MKAADYPLRNVGPASPYDVERWRKVYRELNDLARQMNQIINAEARWICEEAGLSPDLLGIHPYNAIVSKNAGNPWEGVDYNRVQICMDLLRIEFDANKAVYAWDQAVRGQPQQRWLKETAESDAVRTTEEKASS